MEEYNKFPSLFGVTIRYSKHFKRFKWKNTCFHHFQFHDNLTTIEGQEIFSSHSTDIESCIHYFFNLNNFCNIGTNTNAKFILRH